MNIPPRRAGRTTAPLRGLGRLAVALACLLPASACPAGDNADRWPEFRGPTANGHSEATDLPVHWGEKENVRWKTRIHDKGWSSPVVWGNQVWLTTATVEGKHLYAVCLDRDTGRIVHDIKVFDVAHPPDYRQYNSYASPTPVIEAGRVYVHFGSPGTACLDTATGRTLWARRDLPCNHWRGAGSSPVLYRDLLFINFDGYDTQYVVALDKHTGRTRWKQDRHINYRTDNGDLKKAFGTPAVVHVGDHDELVSPAAVATIAYDPETGHELWTVYHGGMNVAARPVAGLGLVFVSGGEVPLSLQAVRPGGKGDVTKTHVVWKETRQVPARPSLLLIGDLLYMINDAGVATCMVARTGKVVWQKRLPGRYVASPVYADGRIYLFDDAGTGYVLATGRALKVLARNRLDDGCKASPAVAGHALLVRTMDALYRIEQTK